jgi:hypothetical protein
VEFPAGSSPTSGPAGSLRSSLEFYNLGCLTRATAPGADQPSSCSGESQGGRFMTRLQTHYVCIPFRILDRLEVIEHARGRIARPQIRPFSPRVR